MSDETPRQGDPVTLRQIVTALGVTYKDGGIAIWLDAPQGYLHGQRAIDLCKTSEGRALVADAVERLDGVNPREEQP